MKPKKQKRRAFVSTYIYDSLRKGIESQTYPLGSYLPSEYQLCEEFKASRMTVRNSLKRLKKEGFITTEPGKGWKVLRDTPSSHLTCKGPVLLLGLNQDICNIVMKKIILSL
ncbi:MAG: winged helix-turn-helix domain-containing protein, partial [Candidatus Bathyarchaeia archaeon]